MQVAFLNTDGTNLAPGISFTLEPTSGIYRAANNDVRVTIAGQAQIRWTSTGCSVWDLANSVWVPFTSAAGVLVPLLNANSIITGNWSFSGVPVFNAGFHVAAGTALFDSPITAGGALTHAQGAAAIFQNAGATSQSTVTQIGTDMTTNVPTTATWQVAAAAVMRLASTGLGFLSGKVAAFWNAGNTASQTIGLGSADELVTGGRGGLWGWLPSTLPRGRVSISTTTPAATGSPGDIVLVYE